MTEEDFFRENYPDSCYGDKPLSPHWDFFQDGVAFGEQQSEKKIADLKELIEKMKSCRNCMNNCCFKWQEPCRDCVKHSNWKLRELIE